MIKDKVIHILSKHINWSNGGNLDDQFTIDELLGAMPEIFKLICDEQKKSCANVVEFTYSTDVRFLIDEIKTCETIKFE